MVWGLVAGLLFGVAAGALNSLIDDAFALRARPDPEGLLRLAVRVVEYILAGVVAAIAAGAAWPRRSSTRSVVFAFAAIAVITLSAVLVVGVVGIPAARLLIGGSTPPVPTATPSPTR